MYEDTPQELVHDLISEAVFGSHPLGRPVIGTAEVISSVSRRAIQGYHRSMYAPANIVVSAAGNLEHERLVELVQASVDRRAELDGREAARAVAARPHAQARPPLPAQGHRAVPRLPRRARRLALRPAALRGVDPRRDPRRLGVVAPLPGDPREARHGLLGLQLRLASTRTPGRSGSTSGRARTTSPRRSRSRPSRSPTSPAAALRASELERAKENLKGRVLLSMESTSTHMNRLGKALITDIRDPLAGADRGRGRRGRARGGRGARRGCCSRRSGSRPQASGRARSGSSRRSKASRRRSLARRERPAQRLFAAVARHGQGRRGARAAARAAGHTLVATEAEADAMVDFTTPDASCRTSAARWRPACRASSARPAGTRPRSTRGARGRRGGLLRPELRHRRRADDALRRGGVGLHGGGRDHRAAPRDEARRALGHGEGDRGGDAGRRADPLRAPAGLVAHRR